MKKKNPAVQSAKTKKMRKRSNKYASMCHQCVTDVNNCLSEGHFLSHALRIKHNLGPTVYLFFWQFRARFSGHQSNAIEVCLHCIYSHRIPFSSSDQQTHFAMNILCYDDQIMSNCDEKSIKTRFIAP